MSSAPAIGRRRTGQVVSVLVAAFLLFDAVIHLLNIDVVKSSMTELGYPTHLSPVIGVIELCCVAFYVVRRSAVLGAVLLAGFLVARSPRICVSTSRCSARRCFRCMSLLRCGSGCTSATLTFAASPTT